MAGQAEERLLGGGAGRAEVWWDRQSYRVAGKAGNRWDRLEKASRLQGCGTGR